MGLFDDDERRRRLTRFYLLNGYFDNDEDQNDENDVFLTPEVQKLKDLGIDIYDFEFMEDHEKLKLLRDYDLNPYDYIEYFMDFRTIDYSDDDDYEI